MSKCEKCADRGYYAYGNRTWSCSECIPAGKAYWRDGVTQTQANAAIFDEETKDRGYDVYRVSKMRGVITKIDAFSANAHMTAPHASAGVLAMTRYYVANARKVA